MLGLTLSRLHWFFRQVSESASWAMMLGGPVEVSPLNQWVIIGLHPRQTLILQENQLEQNGIREAFTGPNRQVQLFERMEQARQKSIQWRQEKHSVLPMAGGLAGCFGYGFYRWCDSGWAEPPEETESSDYPDMVLCEFEDWLLINLTDQQLTILTRQPERAEDYQAQWLTALNRESADETIPQREGLPEDYLDTFQPSFTPKEFADAVEQLKANIRQGEIYQANLSIRLQKRLSLDPYLLFERLCRKNPSPFSGFFKWPGGVIVSNSPERLVQVDENGLAQTRPIAGTRGRGKTGAEDETIGQTLLNNEKERAEHLMLVDLARNDIGRHCTAGSVQVNDLLVLERYSHVTHLVSNVQGQLHPQATGWDVLSSLFPGGTITGCPKIRCVEILNREEPVPRGFYTGSMGYLDAASKALDLNILIRTVFLRETAEPLVYNGTVHVGAGIVYDAVGAHEYRECLRKAAAILNELYLIECQPSKMGSL